MRPRYENEQSLNDEDLIKNRLEKAWGCALKKLKPHDRIDFAAIRNSRVVSVIEVKRRKCSLYTYEDIVLSMSKHQAGMVVATYYDVPFLFVVHFDDCIAFANLSTSNVFLSYGGRTRKTRDEYDIELIVKIPVSDFKVITGVD